ncbi:MAG: hypothetical protein AB8B91_24795 [Rubripirellula sp.]
MSQRGQHASTEFDERSTMFAGCLATMGSAVLTCILLFINGSLVMAVLSALAREGPSWASNPKFSQFMLFLLPVALAVAQWMMLDYVRTRLMHRPAE